MYRSLPLILTLALLPGCGVLDDLFGLNGPAAKETGSSELKAFASKAELRDYLADQIETRNSRYSDVALRDSGDALLLDEAPLSPTNGTTDAASGGDGSGSAAPQDLDADAGGDFSQTTIQEQGVDESDVVKTDGSNAFIMAYTFGGAVLRIARLSPTDQLALLGEVSLEGYGRELYLYDDKVIALTESGGGYFILEGGSVATDEIVSSDGQTAPDTEPGVDLTTDSSMAPIFYEYVYQRPSTMVTVVDVSAPESPVVLSSTAFDGTTSASRMIGGVLHLVVSNHPNYYFDVLPLLGTPELDLDVVDVDELLPTYRRVDSAGVETVDTMITHADLFRPTDPDGFGIVTVVSLDVDDDAAFTAVGIVADPGLIYSSLNALYLTDTEYDFTGDRRETTDIYKFAYVDRGVVPTVTGSVPGRILNQYSMSEYGGYFRVATTVGPTFSFLGQRAAEPHNNVFVLQDNGASLKVTGSVEDIAPRETIQACRFVGDRGYVVTFERIDPLFTLDLSNPAAPRVVGELKVPGFSTFLAPIDENHLLAVGQYIPEDGFFFGAGVELSIFDVTDFEHPVRSAHVVLGENGTAYSEALNNPKALTYFRERGLVALPATIYDDIPFIANTVFIEGDGGDAVEGSGGTDVGAPPPDELVESVIEPYVPTGFEGLVVFSVSAETGFAELGRISTRFESAGIYGSSFTRGLFIDDDVFAVTDRAVRGAALSDVNTPAYEMVFPAGPIGGIATLDPAK